MVGMTIRLSTTNLHPGVVRRQNQATLCYMHMQEDITSGHVKMQSRDTVVNLQAP
ncbi:hypothetical protein NUITMVK11_2990 (plasmid) [Klebsiella quasipneumoniae]|uniref:Uncharacterized protein n=1 Tax=Klebsiella quasipneumoniae TaxID=1463165 RepID=A0AB33IUV7_9ENTR|nr:hypothetical protein NUITMVK11_2990 [Klebsiella quasipneumoniae]